MIDIQRIFIEPAENGFVVTTETIDDSKMHVFATARQLMRFVGSQVNAKPSEAEEE